MDLHKVIRSKVEKLYSISTRGIDPLFNKVINFVSPFNNNLEICV